MSEDIGWYDEKEKPSEVTVKKMVELCEKAKTMREERKKLEEQAKEMYKDIKTIEAKILQYMEEFGMKNFQGDFGMVVRNKTYSVRQPSSPAARDAFFNYLKEQKVFDNMISINSRTLTSYVKQEIEAKKEEGILDFVPPGLDKPEVIETVSFRKK